MNWDDVAASYRQSGEAREVVYFREVTGALPDFYGPGRWYYAEIHVYGSEFDWFGPIGLATIHEPDAGRPICLSGMVLEQARKHGFGTLGIEQIGERWPNIYWTRAFASWGFHEKLVELGIARYSDGIYEYVPRAMRVPRA
jgi:GNAT superfamily N-acetyltransferase